MLHQLSSLALLLAFAVPTFAATHAPPNNITLLLPVNGTYTNQTNVTYGLDRLNYNTTGMYLNVNFTLTFPNGTRKAPAGAVANIADFDAASGATVECDAHGDASLFSFDNSDAGVYLLDAKVTIGLPTSSVGNQCTGPFSLQEFNLTNGWEVAQSTDPNLSHGTKEQVTTTETFASQPTGTVEGSGEVSNSRPAGSSAMKESAAVGRVVVSLIAVGGIFALL
ncbi:hypothetical protein T439DRAFT_352058 [Meredithblackwellia eburnea MCA 4105]